MSYYEIRPLVLAKLAEVALQSMSPAEIAKLEPDEIMRAAFMFERAMFRVSPEFPDQPNYLRGDQSHRIKPTPPDAMYSYPDNPPPGLTPAPR